MIEGPAFSRSNRGTHLGAGVWWALVDMLDARSCTVVTAGPSELKKFATGKGTASKADMRMALFQRTGEDVADDNQVDSQFLREMGRHLIGDPEALQLPAAQLAVVTKLRDQLPAGGLP